MQLTGKTFGTFNTLILIESGCVMDSKRYQCINPPPFPYTLARMVFKKIGVYANHVKKIYHKCFINDIFFSISEIKYKSFTKRDFFLSFCGVCVWLVWGGGISHI